MGLFDLFRKKKKQTETVINEKSSDDFNILSVDGMVGYIKANLDNPTDENVLKVMEAMAKPDEDQQHLTSEGELPWGWLSRNMPICKPYEQKMTDIALSLKTLNVNDKIGQLEKLISAYYEYKAFCYSKDECYIKYFSDMWEHCHNSKCKDFEYITPYEEELQSLKENRNSLIQEEQRKEYIEKNILPNLRSNLLDIIRSEPGILQVAICKRFPADVKQYISDELYAMTQAGMIVKEKEGRLNKYFIKRK